MTFKDNFSAVASAYREFRPTYPTELFAHLAEIAPATQVAWDCGCGSGQASVRLAEAFARVYATDAAERQIAEAEPHPRVVYRVAPAEASGLPDDLADLILVAQAAHWFDLDAFYAEARRVGRDRALLALAAYNLPRVDPEVDRLIDHLYADVLGAYWPPERRFIDEGYATLPFPFPELPAPPGLAMRAEWEAKRLLGYLSTWSSVGRYRRAHDADPVAAFFAPELARLWPGGERRSVRWPLHLRLGIIEK
jgi:SAM-dependent methyltransferase